jgi:predicted metal-dependent hydrolase
MNQITQKSEAGASFEVNIRFDEEIKQIRVLTGQSTHSWQSLRSLFPTGEGFWIEKLREHRFHVSDFICGLSQRGKLACECSSSE